MKKLFLVALGICSVLFADFTKKGNVVRDNLTQLHWQDNTDANTSRQNWEQAIDYCEALTLDTFDDWRLPNINELLSISDKTKETAPAISHVFTYVAYTPEDLELYKVLYWSSTTPLEKGIYNGTPYDYTNTGMTVNFNYGDEYYYDFYGNVASKDKLNYVRCVRDGF